jgi:hypothetical protein
MLRWPPTLATTAVASVVSLLVCLAAPPTSAQEETADSGSSWLDPSEYRISLGVSFGVAWRSIDGALDGVVWTRQNSGPSSSHFKIDTSDTERWPNASATRALAGMTIPLDIQILLPEFDSLPTKPRLFMEGGYIINLHKDQLAGNAGREPKDWGTADQTAADIAIGRVEQLVQQRNSWFVGGGAAFRLPIDAYETRLGVSVRYHQDLVRVTRRMQFGSVGDVTDVFEQSSSLNHVIREVAPGVSLEVDLDQRGPILIGVYLNTFFGIPIDDEPLTTTIVSEFSEREPGDQMDYYLSTDSIRYSGSIGLRFTWVGY